jgi:hypothetical protein
MPAASVPFPRSTKIAAHDAPSRRALGKRLRTWWERDELDDQLAHGFDIEATPELRLRAAQLVSCTGRVELANAVETVVREDRGRRAAIRASADDLLALAQRLQDERPIGVRGAAMTRRLLTDHATSSLYRPDVESPLQKAVRSARLALDPVEPGKASLQPAA